MKRKTKNILMIFLIVLLTVCSYFTLDSAGKSITSSTSRQSHNFRGTPPDMNSSSSSASDDTNNEGQSGSQKEHKRTSDMSKDESSTSKTRPERSSENSEGESVTKPDESDGEFEKNSDGSNGQMPSMPEVGFDFNKEKTSSDLDVIYYALFGIESVAISSIVIYLLMSGFNKKSFKETFGNKDKVVIYVLSIVLLGSFLTFGEGYISKKYFNTESKSSSTVSTKGAKTLDGSSETLTDSYESTTSDESSILVKNGGTATIKGAKVKKSGDSTNTENSEFYGVNSGILVQKGSKAKISKAKISTSSKGSNAVFATGEGSEVQISDSTITTEGQSSARGLDATYGGTIKADNITVTTEGDSCASIATDRGGGTVSCENCNLETNGFGSPIIYSTGDISITDTEGSANGSQNVVIEGKNSATITNSTLTSSGKGNRGNVDSSGVMIYQSMSGDASEGTGTFNSKNSTLKIDSNSDYYQSAPMFFITNTDAVINLENTKLEYGSNILISIKGTSEWGTDGSNGGNLTLNASNQELNGNIFIDNISTMTLNMTKSTYSGTINGDNSAKEINLKIDKDSKISLTGDSYVTTLEDDDTSYSNIDFNGYKLYVNGESIN